MQSLNNKVSSKYKIKVEDRTGLTSVLEFYRIETIEFIDMVFISNISSFCWVEAKFITEYPGLNFFRQAPKVLVMILQGWY